MVIYKLFIKIFKNISKIKGITITITRTRMDQCLLRFLLLPKFKLKICMCKLIFMVCLCFLEMFLGLINLS